jgi:hypothetical protein
VGSRLNTDTDYFDSHLLGDGDRSNNFASQLLGSGDYFDLASNQAKSCFNKYLSIKYSLVSVTIADYIMYVPNCLDRPPTTEAVGLHPMKALYTRSILSHITDCFLYPALYFLSTVAKVLG